MRVVMFYQSLISDWNLPGIPTIRVFEAWRAAFR